MSQSSAKLFLFLFIATTTLGACEARLDGDTERPGELRQRSPLLAPHLNGRVLLFVAYDEVWWAEYKVLYEGLIAAGYEVDVVSSGEGYANTYGDNIFSSAEQRGGYGTFTQQFEANFGGDWMSAWNAPSPIALSGRIQDIENMSLYDALLIAGGVGARNYRYDNSYAAFPSVNPRSSAAEVEAAAVQLNTLAGQALASGKAVGSQCHAGTLSGYFRTPGTSGGQGGLGQSVLAGGLGTAFPSAASADAFAAVGTSYLGDETVVISGTAPAEGLGRVITSRDWYPQTVAYFARTALNLVETYPSPEQLSTTVEVLVFGGAEPDHYSVDEPGFDPATFTDVANFLADENDDFNFNVTLGDVSFLNDESLANFDVVVDFAHFDIPSAAEASLERFVDEGGGLVGLHHAIWNPGGSNSILIDMFGGELPPGVGGVNNELLLQYFGESNHMINVNYGNFISTAGLGFDASTTHYTPAPSFGGALPNLNPDGDVGRGYWHFSIEANDELYLGARFNSGVSFGSGINQINRLFANDRFLAGSPNVNNGHYDAWGWTRLYDADGENDVGKIVYLQPGETMARSFAHPSYAQAVKNGVLWASLPSPVLGVAPEPPADTTLTTIFSDFFEDEGDLGPYVDFVPGGHATPPQISDGVLLVDGTNNAYWYANTQSGAFLGVEAAALGGALNGDFLIQVDLRAHSPGDVNTPPNGAWRVAGIMARSTTDPSDWVFPAVGRGAGSVLGAQILNTTNHSSARYDHLDGTSGQSSLRLCRVGQIFSVYRRLASSNTWQQLNGSPFQRADLAGEVEVGVALGAYLQGPGVAAEVSALQIGVPSNIQSCLADFSIQNGAAEICGNDLDDDGDGVSDCDDTDCSTAAECLPPVIEICDNQLDDDADGFIDCDDDECTADSYCQTPPSGLSATFFDDFNYNSVSEFLAENSFENLNPEMNTLSVTNGDLVIVHSAGASWWGQGEGSFLRRTLTGNFLAEIEMSPHAPGNANAPPSGSWRVGGLMAQSVSQSTDSVFPAMGAGLGGQLGAQHIDTNNGSSVRTDVLDGSYTGALRLCRVDGDIRSFRRSSPGVEWDEIVPNGAPANGSWIRNDIQDAYVGIAANAYGGGPNVTIRVHHYLEAVPGDVLDCVAMIQ